MSIALGNRIVNGNIFEVLSGDQVRANDGGKEDGGLLMDAAAGVDEVPGNSKEGVGIREHSENQAEVGQNQSEVVQPTIDNLGFWSNCLFCCC